MRRSPFPRREFLMLIAQPGYRPFRPDLAFDQ